MARLCTQENPDVWEAGPHKTMTDVMFDLARVCQNEYNRGEVIIHGISLYQNEAEHGVLEYMGVMSVSGY